MNIIDIRTWNEFEQTIEKITMQYKDASSSFYFRGQSNAEWTLTTTLERVVGFNLELAKYYYLIDRAKGRIETFTGKYWDLDLAKFSSWLNSSHPHDFNLPSLEYLVYLRHHGFPSPLLDWSVSPFIAAYFAFKDLSKDRDSVAVFAYLEQLGEGKRGELGNPFIRHLRINFRADPRHFLQQSVYTVCTAGENRLRYFSSHEEVFLNPADDSQDLLWKFVLPASERKAALHKLDTYNINSFSIFQTEESLMETVFLREYISGYLDN